MTAASNSDARKRRAEVAEHSTAGVEPLTQAECDAGVYPGGVTWLSDKAAAEIVAARVASVVDDQDRTLKFYDQINTERIAAEAEVARLTAQHDECHYAFTTAKTGLDEAQAENRRLTALVEAGLALVDDVTDRCCPGNYCIGDAHDLRLDQVERLQEVIRSALGGVK